MTSKNVVLNDDDEVMRRCRRARDQMNRRFKTVDALFDHLERLEKEARAKRERSGVARSQGMVRPAARNSKPTNRKPVHKS